MNPLSLAIGLALGLIIGWLLAARRTQADREARVAAETRLEGLQEQLAAQQSLLEAAKAQLSDSFKALSLDALQANSRTFEDRTRQTLEPLQEALRRYEDHVHAIEQAASAPTERWSSRSASLRRASSGCSRRRTTW